jgi:hypothetical protein
MYGVAVLVSGQLRHLQQVCEQQAEHSAVHRVMPGQMLLAPACRAAWHVHVVAGTTACTERTRHRRQSQQLHFDAKTQLTQMQHQRR